MTCIPAFSSAAREKRYVHGKAPTRDVFFLNEFRRLSDSPLPGLPEPDNELRRSFFSPPDERRRRTSVAFFTSLTDILRCRFSVGSGASIFPVCTINASLIASGIVCAPLGTLKQWHVISPNSSLVVMKATFFVSLGSKWTNVICCTSTLPTTFRVLLSKKNKPLTDTHSVTSLAGVPLRMIVSRASEMMGIPVGLSTGTDPK
mmetsp:Transcript_23769/g.62143  ORF Transcript_23769/g.62143 Transcript_23769/m.62143 type:complete len:203 (-) Transcript_23769:157-765(-)